MDFNQWVFRRMIRPLERRYQTLQYVRDHPNLYGHEMKNSLGYYTSTYLAYWERRGFVEHVFGEGYVITERGKEYLDE